MFSLLVEFLSCASKLLLYRFFVVISFACANSLNWRLLHDVKPHQSLIQYNELFPNNVAITKSTTDTRKDIKTFSINGSFNDYLTSITLYIIVDPDPAFQSHEWQMKLIIILLQRDALTKVVISNSIHDLTNSSPYTMWHCNWSIKRFDSSIKPHSHVQERKRNFFSCRIDFKSWHPDKTKVKTSATQSTSVKTL